MGVKVGMGAEVGSEEGRSREISGNEGVKFSVKGWHKGVFKIGSRRKMKILGFGILLYLEQHSGSSHAIL